MAETVCRHRWHNLMGECKACGINIEVGLFEFVRREVKLEAEIERLRAENDRLLQLWPGGKVWENPPVAEATDLPDIWDGGHWAEMASDEKGGE